MKKVLLITVFMGCSSIAAMNDATGKLFEAAQTGNVEAAQRAIVGGVAVNVKDNFGSMPLHWAALRGHKLIVQLLLGNGALVDVKDCQGWTALHRAALWGHTPIAQLLLSSGAPVDIKSDGGVPPLHYAAAMGHTLIAQLLLAHQGPAVRSLLACQKDPSSRFFPAVLPRDIHALLCRYVDSEEKINMLQARTNKGHTAYDSAMENGHNETAQRVREYEEKCKKLEQEI